MKTVEERQAHEWLPLLLDDIEGGDQVLITRNGAPLACLQRAAEATPVAKPMPAERQGEIHDAMLRIRKRAQTLGMRFDWSEVKLWRDEGRR